MAMQFSSGYYSNRLSAESACEYCTGVRRHTKWCRLRNKKVQYAYDIIVYPEKMTLHDILALKGMSVAWCNSVDYEKVNG